MSATSLTETLRETLAVFDGDATPLTTTEVADRLEVGRRSTYERLERLVDRGCLETKKAGASGRVWWRRPSTEATSTAAAGSPEAVSPAAAGPTGSDRADESVAAGGTDESVAAGGADESTALVGAQFDSLVDAVEEYAIFRLDTAGRVRSWNPGAERIKGYAAGEVLGEHFGTFYTEADRAAGVPAANLAAAGESGTAEDEGWRVRADGSRFWAHVTITTVHDDDGDRQGYVKVTRDTTERREYEQRLRRERDLTRRVLETAPASIAVLDSTGTVVTANERFETRLGVDGAAGQFSVDDLDVYGEDGTPVPPERRPYRTVVETGEPVTDWECRLEVPSGDRYWASLGVAPVIGDGSRPGDAEDGVAAKSADGGSERVDRVVVAVQDITQLKERKRDLERQRDDLEHELAEVFDRIDDGFFALDGALRFTHVNDRAAALLDRSAGELVGQSVWAAFPEASDSRFRAAAERALESQASVSVEEYYAARDRWFEVAVYPSETGLSVYLRDVSDRKERERELGQRVRQQATVARLGRRALEDRDVDELLADAAATVADVLGTDYCKVLDLDAEREELLLRQGVGWADGIVGEATVSAVDDDSQAAHTLSTERPVVVENLATEPRFSGPALLTDHDVGSGISVVVGPSDDPWGVLGAHDTDRRTFPDHDVTFVESVSNVLASAIERHRDERALRRQREQLAALDDLNRTVREVTDAVLTRSTRAEIAQTVCDHLAAADSYQFAWVGEVDVTSGTVELAAEAGVDGYLDGVTITVDPDDERSGGPTGRALRTGTVQTTQDVDVSEAHDPWRDHVERYDFRSSAAIPVVHGDTTYGVLNVYADRPNAFEGQEGAVLGQLGEVVGHAIAAAERKRALMSDDVVELEFRIEDVFGVLDRDGTASSPVRFEHAVPTGDDEFVVFGHTDDDGAGTVTALVDAVAVYDNVTFRADGEDVTFELTVSDAPVLSMLASLGGSFEEAVVADGDYRIRVHLPPSADVGRLVETMTETYPSANLLRRRQLTVADPDVPTEVSALTAALTDRQRAAVETAYHAGFFEWPRAADGESVADSLGIAGSTFHQHLRKAERKLFEAVFTASSARPRAVEE